MKKLLALVLALVMTLSLCVTSNAAYKDAADVELDEAVDVLTAVGVFQGDENGKMNPKANLTREQAAKLVAYLQIGQKAADALVGGSKFTDVAKTAWSAGYVDYCASTGVVNGVGDGKFDPAGSLTALQFGKMLLVCLGYDAKAEGMTGTDWTINTSKLMTSADLLDNLAAVNANTVITREQAAQMMLNALQAPMVEYTNKATTISVNGAVIDFGGSTASYVTSTVAKDQTISTDRLSNDTAFTIELGEKLFPKLTLKPTTDDFKRPAHEWKYDTKSVGVYADEADATYVVNTKKGDIYSDLGLVKTVYATVYEDGAEAADLTLKKGDSTKTAYGTGAVVECYANEKKDEVKVVVINQYLAQVTKVKSDDNGEYIVVDASEFNPTLKLDDKTFHVEGFEVDDYVVLNVTVDDGDLVIGAVYAPEKVVGKVDAVEEETTKRDAYIELDGTKYTYNDVIDETDVADPVLDDEYTLFLDANGYVVGYKAAEKAAKQYAYVKAVGEDEWRDLVAAKLVFANATTEKVEIAKGENKGVFNTKIAAANNGNLEGFVVSYTKSAKDVYTLTAVAKQVGTVNASYDAAQFNGIALGNKSAYINGVLADEDTLYVDVKDECTYTGYENLPDYTGAKGVVIKDKYSVADTVFIISWDTKDNADTTYFYVKDATAYKTKVDADDVNYVVRTGDYYYDDDVENMKLTVAANNVIKANGIGWYKTTKIDTSDYVSGVAFLGNVYDNIDAKGSGTFQPALTGGLLRKALDAASAPTSAYWYYNADTQWVLIDLTGSTKKVTDAAASDMVVYDAAKLDIGDKYTQVRVVESDKNLAEVVALYVVKYTENVTISFDNTYAGTFTASHDGVNCGWTNTATKNSTYTFTVDAAKGYNVKSVKVGDKTLTPVDGVYSVKADEAKTIAVTTVPEQMTVVVAINGINNYLYRTETKKVSWEVGSSITGITLDQTAGTVTVAKAFFGTAYNSIVNEWLDSTITVDFKDGETVYVTFDVVLKTGNYDVDLPTVTCTDNYTDTIGTAGTYWTGLGIVNYDVTSNTLTVKMTRLSNGDATGGATVTIGTVNYTVNGVNKTLSVNTSVTTGHEYQFVLPEVTPGSVVVITGLANA